MSANHKPRKHYKPHGRLLVGGLSVIAERLTRDKPLQSDEQTNVVISYHAAIDAIIGGYANEYNFDTIVHAINIGGLLSDYGYGAEHKQLIVDAKSGMQRCRDRYLATGKFGLDGDGLKAVKAAAYLHEAQVSVATRGELNAAYQEMKRQLGTYD